MTITETVTEVPPQVLLGDFIEGYQVVAQAPVEYIRGTRLRNIGGHAVKGSWSDPWWLYGPQGWAIVKRWKNKDTEVYDGWDPETNRMRSVPVAARNELVVFPWDPESGEL